MMTKGTRRDARDDEITKSKPNKHPVAYVNPSKYVDYALNLYSPGADRMLHLLLQLRSDASKDATSD
ncbi:hypothetical protein D6D01_07904 [Aureobasidium pullulans]|uniref:Uncharacterized protein n=1 Tax=Aureobasidium pullulans TaxID=5580 RepID=A0A4S9KJB4_AURPU|nr:hypothetical protein D6D01_07904 [Aureobasidium pullulans]